MASGSNTYFEVLEAIKNYYGSGSDQWVEIAKYGIASDNAEAILHQVPGVEIIKNADGSIRSYNYNAIESISNSASTINSNALSTQVKTKIPANMGVDSSTGNLTLKSGAATAGNFVVGTVAPAVGAAMLGITLGKSVDKLLYESMPDFWDAHEMYTLNPDTWNTITTDDTINGYLFNTLLNLNPDDNTSQMYLDENAIAYLAYFWQYKGAFDESIVYPDYKTTGKVEISSIQTVEELYTQYKNYINPIKYNSDTVEVSLTDFIERNKNKAGYLHKYIGTPRYYGSSPLTLGAIDLNVGDNITLGSTKISSEYLTTKGSKTEGISQTINILEVDSETSTHTVYQGKEETTTQLNVWGVNSTKKSSIEGIDTQSGATTPDLSTATSIADTLALLKEQFPELWEKAVTQNVVQLDGSIKVYTYIPVATPDAISATDTQPTSGTSTQADPVVNPETSPEILLNLIASIAGSTPTPTDTNTESEIGKGSTPSLIVPVGSASALYKIYNPTQEQLNSFGAWLWSNDFVDQLLKMFNDPMQAIIGLHKVYSPVSVGGTTDIKVGYLSSGVTSNYINEQYVTVDCGSINLSEFFNNVFDYDPFTKVYIYLPFIGIQQLHTGDVMRSSINVKYHVDVLTGTCLAEINITRDGGGGILYTYSGNCAVQYPLSSGNYMGLIGSLASVAGSVAGAVISGGALTPMALGAISGLSHAHTNVSHSGNFSGNAGAMGVKIPYLIITRPQTELANTFPHNDGYPVNYSTTIGQCSGYIEVESVHVENIPATESELVEIENLLKSGVLV